LAAGAGIKVAKHGNYGVSSISGPSNVMETRESDLATIMIFRKSMDKAGIAILHAPLFIHAKKCGPIRKARRKNFNMLGPMVNPSLSQNQRLVFSI
jgi:anthranilate phosphoribosyltransferase